MGADNVMQNPEDEADYESANSSYQLKAKNPLSSGIFLEVVECVDATGDTDHYEIHNDINCSKDLISI